MRQLFGKRKQQLPQLRQVPQSVRSRTVVALLEILQFLLQLLDLELKFLTKTFLDRSLSRQLVASLGKFAGSLPLRLALLQKGAQQRFQRLAIIGKIR